MKTMVVLSSASKLLDDGNMLNAYSFTILNSDF